jgi:hypothetical protein
VGGLSLFAKSIQGQADHAAVPPDIYFPVGFTELQILSDGVLVKFDPHGIFLHGSSPFFVGYQTSIC